MESRRTVYRVDLGSEKVTPVQSRKASSLRIKEKQVENWMAKKPGLLFTNPDALLVIAQEFSGEVMADILAVDSQGNLIIIEIKRESCDRSTIGQLLDYAARLSAWQYEDFNLRWKQHTKGKQDLFDAFKEFVENPNFDPDDFLRDRRLFILASSEDDSMKRILSWLRDTYDVPVDFVPFQFFEDDGRIYLDIAKIDIDPLSLRKPWLGDWLFNTNEKYSKNAYVAMLEQEVIPVFGYANGKEMLEQPSLGERVFAYLNGRGIVAAGKVTGQEATASGAVFNKAEKGEFHRSVEWDVKLPLAHAVTAAEVSQWGYNLPVRSTLCKMYAGNLAEWILTEMRKRSEPK